MNLAEIRKKAVGARKPEDPERRPVEEPLGEVSAGVDEQDLQYGIESGEALEESPDFDFFADTCEEGGYCPETFETDFYPASDELTSSGENQGETVPNFTEVATEIPEQVTELPAQIAPPESSRIVPVSDEPVPATVVRHPAYDPLAILLAGRQAAEEGSDLPVEEELGRSSDEVEEYLCFKVADEEYALSIMAIKEIIKPREVTEVPRMPRFVTGVISLRGIIIPIMDMRLRLSLAVGEATGRERILVLKTSNGLCGVLVDEVIQVVRIGGSAIEGPPTILDGVDREFVMGLGRFDNRMLILLNLETILDLNVH